MKTRFLITTGIGLTGIEIVIIMMLLVPSGNYDAYGLWVPQTPEELFQQSETVFVGTIQSVNILEFERSNERYVEENGVSKMIVENYTQTLDEYTVSIEEFLKNPQESNTITMLEATVGGVPGRSVSIGGFELGDRVLFYVPKLDGTNQYSPESFKIPKQCGTKSVLEESRIQGGNYFKIMQEDNEKRDNFTANKPIEFAYEKDMRTLDGKSFDIEVFISKMIDEKKYTEVFHEKLSVSSNPCEWIATAKWEFTPHNGKYAMDIHIFEDSSRTSFSKHFSVENTAFDKIQSSLKQPDPLDLWNEHDLIIDGTIIDSMPHKTHPVTLQYDIKINEYFKPSSKSFQLITATTNDTSTYFEPNTRALFYLKQIDGAYKVSIYSVKTFDGCDARDLIEISPVLPNETPPISTPALTESYFDPCIADYFTYDPDFFKGIVNGISPLKQIKHGIPNSMVRCYDGLIQVIKHDGSLACVRPETKQMLIERGWAKPV